MNENNSKILFNKSSLINLKAELIKKQEEVNEKKRLPQHKLENYKPPKPQPQEKSKSVKKTFKDNLVAVDTEELEACRKSKAALQKKAELYDHLSDFAGTSKLAGQFLVDFDSKKQHLTPEPVTLPNLGEEPANIDDEDDWTEFVDCLGRTRKCLKTDLEEYKKRDLDLVLQFGKQNNLDLIPKSTEEAQPINIENDEVVQKTKDYLQSLREKWEQKEAELLTKDGDIHYQDLLFDEARMHGVGYYSFSTNEAERRKQMADLIKTREETLKAQKENEIQRKKREELLASRTAAIKARMRLKAGLPPEEPQEKKKDFETCLLEFLNEKRNEAEIKAKEEEKRLKEELEKEREKLRKAHVREWDVGKEGVGGKREKFRQLTQEEYVEQQRDKRINEFAPPTMENNIERDKYFDDKGSFVNRTENTKKTWSDVRPSVSNISDNTHVHLENENKSLYFKSKKDLKYKNFVKSSTLIVNELEEDVQEKPKSVPKRTANNYAEIAPPASFEYYGPPVKQHRSNTPFDSNIHEAYNQGVQQLEKKKGNANISEMYDFIL